MRLANDMTSSNLIHPGEMIKDEIIARGITQKEQARQMGVSYTVFNEILNGKRALSLQSMLCSLRLCWAQMLISGCGFKLTITCRKFGKTSRL